MQRIADWLEKLGMSENAERFAENRIDFSVLPELTDQDLKDLGIVLGDRRKILRAIAALDSARAAQSAPVVAGVGATVSFAAKPTSAAATSPQAPSSPAGAQAAGKRRYLRVLFCGTSWALILRPPRRPRSGGSHCLLRIASSRMPRSAMPRKTSRVVGSAPSGATFLHPKSG
jgi:uncharacterized protein YjiS (DUF1127 family)